jgi:hypothetical protein
MEISDFLLQLTGKASIPEKLEVGEDLTIGLGVNIYKSEITNNEDGTWSECYKVKPTGEILITKKWGNTPIKAKLRNSSQTRFRWALLKYHRESGIAEDFETWYPKYIDNKIAELMEK